MDNYIYVIDDYRTSNVYLHIYLSLHVNGGCYFGWACVVSSCHFEILVITFSFTRCVNITCHIASPFSRIFTCSHTLVAPHGLQKLGGVSTLIYASDVLMSII